MERTIFYAPDILITNQLPEEESAHCSRVLRKRAGDEILITDGKGTFVEACITLPHPKHTGVKVQRKYACPKHWQPNIHIAFAPTKNIDRIEWFLEKATEIGIDQVTPILCEHSERKEVKPARLEKILISAMKQSQKALLPRLNEMIPFKRLVEQATASQKLIAHCHNGEKTALTNIPSLQDVIILIGPEGDFSEAEVELALRNGFSPISLGQSRLRTETAALVACHTLHIAGR